MKTLARKEAVLGAKALQVKKYCESEAHVHHERKLPLMKIPAARTDSSSTTHPVRHWSETTSWNMVLSAGHKDNTEGALALEALCQTYWYPLYAYIRHRGIEADEARDLTQEFFARLVEHHWLEQAHPSRGKFRSFLLASVNHFLANEWRKAQAAKRGGGRPVVSLDDTAERRYATEPFSDENPEKLYERQWLLRLFEVALERLRQQYSDAGKMHLFTALNEFLSSDVKDGDYARLGKELSMNHGAISTAVCRLRHRYQELVREEIGRTVASPADVDEEIKGLLRALA